MTDERTRARSTSNDPVMIDSTVPHPSRIYDYLLGGTDNFEVDRAAAQRAGDDVGGIENARHDIRSNRSFLGWAVRHLAGDLGVRQFLDLGTGIPNADNVHGVAQSVAPDARIVYVDNDPVVLAQSHNLLHSTAEGATAYLDGDLRDPQAVLQDASATLDFTRPVAVMLVAVLHLLRDDEDDPQAIVDQLVDALAPGSYVVITHLAKDIEAEQMARMSHRVNETLRGTLVLRTQAEVARFFDGLEVLPPGVVAIDQWPAYDGKPTPPAGRTTPYYVGIGRKP